MEGVILYADDNIFIHDDFVNRLFKTFNETGDFSIIPIDNLLVLEKTVTSISTFKALILDWNFKMKMEDEMGEGFKNKDEDPFDFLMKTDIYSLIYIYSQAEIPSDQVKELKGRFGDKIFFQTKNLKLEEVQSEFEKIVTGIDSFEKQNTHLEMPFIWSQTINSSAQKIFHELELADPNWISEIYSTASKDGGEPNTEVISIFQNLLSESLIQNQQLINSLRKASEIETKEVGDREEALAKLYNRIYYTRLVKDAPIMTGDIFKFAENEFGILITPECDLGYKKDKCLEFLLFSVDGFDLVLKKQHTYEKKDFNTIKEKTIAKLKQVFNNPEGGYHILPSFPFSENNYNSSACIDFKTGFQIFTIDQFNGKRDLYKLNSPYIYQLRQRYLAYLGRVGTPSMPSSLREYNLK